MTQKNDPLVPEPDPAEDTADESNMTLSLMGGVAKPEGMPEPADLDLQSMKGGSKLLNQGTLVIVLVFAVAIGTLYLMRHTQADLGASGLSRDLQAKIEMALAKQAQPDAMAANDPLRRDKLDAMFRNTDSIVRMFNDDTTRRQVPIEFVKQNPFAMAIAQPVADAHDDSSQLNNRERLRQLGEDAKHMVLQSVMNGRLPVAIIDGEFYKIGQTIGPFTISDIKERQVDLVADGATFTLKMTEENGDRPKGR